MQWATLWATGRTLMSVTGVSAGVIVLLVLLALLIVLCSDSASRRAVRVIKAWRQACCRSANCSVHRRKRRK